LVFRYLGRSPGYDVAAPSEHELDEEAVADQLWFPDHPGDVKVQARGASRALDLAVTPNVHDSCARHGPWAVLEDSLEVLDGVDRDGALVYLEVEVGAGGGAG